MTRFLPAYDTELINDGRYPSNVVGCLAACERIAEVHRRYEAPATFFIVGRLLEQQGAEFRELLDDDLFAIGSHSYSHKLLLDHPICGPAARAQEIEEEIVRGKLTVEETFSRPCLGFRPGCGFEDGLDGHPELLETIANVGFRYVSSDLWGPGYSLPVPPRPPRTYRADGFPELWELPACGWHENLLKGNNRIFGGAEAKPMTVLQFPPPFPNAVPPSTITRVDEELQYNNRFFLARGVALRLPIVSFIWHPWSLHLFDPEMEMLKRTFDLIGEDPDIEVSTFDAEYRRLADPQTLADR